MFFFLTSAAAIIIYYVVKHIVEQRNDTEQKGTGRIARHIERVDHNAGRKGKREGRREEGYLTRPVIDCVYHAKPLPTLVAAH